MNPTILRGILHSLQTEQRQGRRLLDASAAAGESSRAYKELGFDVVASDYDPSVFQVQDVPCIQADLNASWPFESGSFDIIVLQEVIEHLENVPHVFREARRILRPGGCLIMSTPNMLNWTSRLRFLFTGYYQGRKKPLRISSGLGDAGNWHVLPFHVYLWVGHHSRFELETVIGVRWRLHSILIGLLGYPIGAAYTYLWWVVTEKNPAQKRFNLAVWKQLFSKAVLFGTNMVMKFRKQPHAE
jgi:SAM-dependent methyltransferase